MDQANNRKEWMTYVNFEKVYNLVYTTMVEAGVAQSYPIPFLMDKLGKIVVKEADAYGLPVDLKLNHNDNVFFVNEVINKTNITKVIFLRIKRHSFVRRGIGTLVLYQHWRVDS